MTSQGGGRSSPVTQLPSVASVSGPPLESLAVVGRFDGGLMDGGGFVGWWVGLLDDGGGGFVGW